MEKSRKSHSDGFTLVEMIVTIVIIGILLAILVPGMFKYIDKAKDKQMLVNATSSYKAVQAEILYEYAKPDANIMDIASKYQIKKGLNNNDIPTIPGGARVLLCKNGGTEIQTFFSDLGINDFINYKTGEIEAMLYIENGKYVTYTKYTGWGEAKDFNGVIIE